LSEIDDIAFVRDLIKYLSKEICLDGDCIFAVGFSNGGGLTALLAGDKHLSIEIAGFAICSGAFYKDSALRDPVFSRCAPGRTPIPILEFHGDKDPVIHYDGKTTPDGETYNIKDWLTEWARRNDCSVDAGYRCESLYNGNVDRSIWSKKRSNGDDRDLVIHYYIHGFGHGWPTTTPLDNDFQRYGPTYFDATPLILDFFFANQSHHGVEDDYKYCDGPALFKS
jgi:poly(3-hydroxybutyrate) depolymerase